MKIALAQINPLLGNIPFNEKKIKEYIQRAEQKKAQLVVFPEMALNGYPPLDMVYHPCFQKKTHLAIKNIHQGIPKDVAVLIGAIASGHPSPLNKPKNLRTNAVFLLQKGAKAQVFLKEHLADYDVFDEKRYFHKGSLTDNGFLYQGQCFHIFICEDMWQEPDTLPPLKQKPDLILSLNGSPFELSKAQKRVDMAKKWLKKYPCPLVYVNMVGGQEELIFDGGSFVLDNQGQVIHHSPFFKEDLSVVDLSLQRGGYFKAGQGSTSREHSPVESPASGRVPPLRAPRPWGLSKEAKIALAVKFGLKEFVLKNGFTTVHIGLSGGLDSAVTATLACQALGSKKVQLIFLPGPFTSALSQRGAEAMAQKLNSSLVLQSVTALYSQCLKTLDLSWTKASSKDITKQNIQARLRSLLLMAYANQNPKSLLLGTANKSELALGYSTLYGDLTGGLLPIGDLFKTEVWALAKYIKVPDFIIKRSPSAELSPNQKDEDDLPSYKILDPVLKKLIEDGEDPQNPFEKQIFQRMTKNQFKRKQSPPILKLKARSFDRGWRWPFLPSGYKA